MIRLRHGMAGWVATHSEVAWPWLICVLLRLVLMVSAFLLTGTTVMTQGDTASYLAPGMNLLLHGHYASGGLAEIDRTPGYPFFAMVSGILFGNVLLTVVFQIVLSSLSLLLIYRIASQTFSAASAGVVAAWLYAVEPVSIVYTVRVMPETLFVFLMLIVIERLLAFLRTGKLSVLIAAGVGLAAATYVRPVSYYLPLALAAGLALIAGRQRGLWWKAPALLLVSTLPLLAAWQVRNAIETGYTGFSSIVEKNLYFFQSAEVSAELDHISLGEEQKRLGYPDESSYISLHPEQRSWTQAQRLLFMRREAMRILTQHEGLYLKTHIAGVGVVALTPCATELLQLLGAYPGDQGMPRRILNEGILASLKMVLFRHPAVAITMAGMEGFLVLLYLCAARGMFFGAGRPAALFTLVGVALYFLLISGGAQAVGRYRVPVMPELSILAAGGIRTGQQKQARSLKGSALVGLRNGARN